jgi:hypothetical protein
MRERGKGRGDKKERLGYAADEGDGKNSRTHWMLDDGNSDAEQK